MSWNNVVDFSIAALPMVLLGLGIAMAASAYRQTRKGEASLLQTGVIVLVFALSLFSAGIQMPEALAAPAQDGKESAVESVETRQSVSVMFGNDMLWVGQTISIGGKDLPNDLLAAGQTIAVSNSKVGGSVRAAAQSVTLSNNEVAESVTLAGQNLTMDGGSATATAMTGQTAIFSGETNEFSAAAQTVTIDGTVHGDVSISAERLELGPHAVIDGTVKGQLENEPTVDEKAKVGDWDYKIVESTDDQAAVSAEEASALSPLAIGGMIASVLVGILGYILIALLAEWLTRKQVVDAAAMAKDRTGAMAGSGVLGGFIAPVALVVLLCTVIGIPLAFALGSALVAIQLVAGGFAAAVLAKITFPNMNHYAGVLVMAVILGVASVIPFIGWLVPVLAFMLLLGYVLQKIYLGLSANSSALVDPTELVQPAPAAEAASAGIALAEVEVAPVAAQPASAEAGVVYNPTVVDSLAASKDGDL